MIRDWIVQQKEARGLSYQDLANAAGLGFHSVHRYLRYEPGQTQHRGLHAEAASKLLYALSAKIVLDE